VVAPSSVDAQDDEEMGGGDGAAKRRRLLVVTEEHLPLGRHEMARQDLLISGARGTVA